MLALRLVMAPFVPKPGEGVRYPNVVQMFQARVRRTPDRPALRYKREGTWRTVTWRGWLDAAREVAAGLRATCGVERGDRVAIISETRCEWALLDLAISVAGAISVPVYPSLTGDRMAHILRDSECKVAVCETPLHLSRLAEHLSGGGPLRVVVTLEEACHVPPREGGGTLRLSELPEDAAGARRLDLGELRARGKAALAKDPAIGRELDAVREELGLHDTFTHVYTSGTTGELKGVVLTHENLVFESWAVRNVVPVDESDEQLLVLPLAHVFSRHLLWGAVEQGAITAFAESPAALEENLLEIAPTFMGAVPRIYEKVYHRILAEGMQGSWPERKLFRWCLEVGHQVSLRRQRGQALPVSLAAKWAAADRAVFARIRAAFGGRLRFFVSGGAPLARDVAEFFHAAGVLVLEGYGLTETTGATNVNRPDRYRFGTVGPAMPGCEIRLADDGEILVRGRNVMKEYLNLPEETAAAFDPGGWLRTGDLGELSDGFLRITGRKKDLIKTATGKYIAPQMIEKRLRAKDGVAHAVVLGDARPYAVALVELDEPAMMARARREGLGVRGFDDLVRHPRVRQIVQGYVDEVNADLAAFEAVRRFAFTPRPLSEVRGELTPTGKVRRQVVQEHFRDLVEGLYDAPPRL